MKRLFFGVCRYVFLLQSMVVIGCLNAAEMSQRMQECLSVTYAFDEQSVATILKKFTPLIEAPEHHATLEQFRALSKAHVPEVACMVELTLPVDDAVQAAPDSHEVLAENNLVRVLYGVTKNGDKDQLHRHYLKSILVNLAPSIFEIEYADGSKELWSDSVAVYALPPDTQAASYKNIGNSSSLLRFEIK